CNALRLPFPEPDGQVSRLGGRIHRREPGPRRETTKRADRDRSETMLEPDFEFVPTAVQIGRCGYPRRAVRRDALCAQSDDSSPEDRCCWPAGLSNRAVRAPCRGRDCSRTQARLRDIRPSRLALTRGLRACALAFRGHFWRLLFVRSKSSPSPLQTVDSATGLRTLGIWNPLRWRSAFSIFGLVRAVGAVTFSPLPSGDGY